MPMTFTDEMVKGRAERLGITGTIDVLRVHVARHSEKEYGDFVEGWEIRTGRPWNEMTAQEAMDLILKFPDAAHNPGVQSRLYQG
jgi:hypothetical protein